MGAELEIPTIDGKVKWTLPAGTQPGTTFRLRAGASPSCGAGAGATSTSPWVQVPTSLTAEQKEALHAFGEAMGEAVPEGGLKGFFDKKKRKK